MSERNYYQEAVRGAWGQSRDDLLTLIKDLQGRLAAASARAKIVEAEFAESRRIAEGVQRAYARYAADRAHFGLPPVTFDQWFRWAIGEVQP